MNPAELPLPRDLTLAEYRYIERLDAHAGRFAACVDFTVYAAVSARSYPYFGLEVGLYPAGCSRIEPNDWSVWNMLNSWQRELAQRYTALVLATTDSKLLGKGDVTALFQGDFGPDTLRSATA